MFWDPDKRTVDPRVHRSYVIRRVMDSGDPDDVRWMLATYSDGEFIDVVKKGRGLSRKSGYLGGNYYRVPKKEIAGLREPYRKRPMPF